MFLFFGMLVWLLQLAASGYAVFQLIVSDMLPVKYIAIAIVVLGVVQMFTTLMLFVGLNMQKPKAVPGDTEESFAATKEKYKKKKKNRTVRRTIAFIVAVLMAYGSLNLGLVMDKVSKTISAIAVGGALNQVDNVQEDPFIVYISGSDTRNNTVGTNERSDVNILMVVNPNSHQILLLNTPRDYYVYNPARGGMDKLTHCGLNGVENSMEALGNLYEVDVNYDVRINFTGLETLVDEVGGITVHCDTSFTSDDGIHFNAGDNYLNGTEALSFARDRHNQADGDNGRGRNQMYVIQAIISKATSDPTVLANYSDILSAMQGMMLTSLSDSEIRSLVRMQADDMHGWNVQQYAVTGSNGNDYCVAAGQSLYVMYPNQDSVNRAIDLVQRVLDGDTLTADDVA